MHYNDTLIKVLSATKSLVHFDTQVIENIDFLNSVWEEIGFERLNQEQAFLKFVLYELECVPIINEDLFSPKYLNKLKERNKLFYQTYKETTQEVGWKILEKLKELDDK